MMVLCAACASSGPRSLLIFSRLSVTALPSSLPLLGDWAGRVGTLVDLGTPHQWAPELPPVRNQAEGRTFTPDFQHCH